MPAKLPCLTWKCPAAYVCGLAEGWDWLRLHTRWVNPPLLLTVLEQRSVAESFTATDELLYVCCSPKPAWGRDFSVPSARGASQLYQKGFDHLWWCEAAPSSAPASPALFPHSPDSCAGTCLVSKMELQDGWEIRNQPTSQLTLLAGCELHHGNRFGVATCSPQLLLPVSWCMSYPEPWSLHLIVF